MLPNNRSSLFPVPAEFLFPDTRQTSLLEDWELGGVAIGNASQGLMVRAWRGWVEGITVKLQADGSPDVIDVYSAGGIKEMSFCFDQNMRPALVLTLDNGSLLLRWFDTQINNFRVDVFTEGQNARLSMDDKRRSQSTQSDMILGYVRGRSLCYRQQRDRFQVEHVLRGDLPRGARLKNIGMGRNWRMQFEIV